MIPRVGARIRLSRQLEELIASRPETKHLSVPQRILLVRDILRAVDAHVDEVFGGGDRDRRTQARALPAARLVQA